MNRYEATKGKEVVIRAETLEGARGRVKSVGDRTVSVTLTEDCGAYKRGEYVIVLLAEIEAAPGKPTE